MNTHICMNIDHTDKCLQTYAHTHSDTHIALLHTHRHLHEHTSMCACTHRNTHALACTCVSYGPTFSGIHTCMNAHTENSHALTHMHHTDILASTHTHACIHSQKHMHTDTCMNTPAHTYTYTLLHPQAPA